MDTSTSKDSKSSVDNPKEREDKTNRNKTETNNTMENIGGNNKITKRKSKLIRSLLIGATLSTAVVSTVTTACGLERYIFMDNPFFAGVLSAAIQGTLYTLSISGPSLLKTNKMRWFGKIMTVVIWAMVLCTSSIFSFVYVSKTAYPDSVMHSDAEQSMSLYLQKQSFNNLDYVNELIETEQNDIAEYIDILNGGIETGFQVSESDQEMFDNYIEELQAAEDSHVNNAESSLFNTTNIRGDLKSIKTGQFIDADLDTCKTDLSKRINSIEDTIGEYNKSIKTCDDQILEETHRLATIDRLHVPEWEEANTALNMTKEKKGNIDKLIIELDNFKGLLSQCLDSVNKFEVGTENTLNQLTKNLNSEINKDIIDTTVVLEISENIYNMLIDGKASVVSNNALSDYGTFKQNIRDYREYIEAKQLIESEINILGNYNQTMISDTNLKIEKGEGEINNPSRSDALEPTGLETITTATGSLHNKATNNEWLEFWSQRLANMLKEIQDLPKERDTDPVTDDVQENETGEKDFEVTQDTKTGRSMNNDGMELQNMHSIDKDSITEKVMDMKRLYLVELNDFDRALTLFKESFFGFHRHGMMVIVSLFIAFGIDLFSTATGIMLYFFKSSKQTPRKKMMN